MTIQFISPFLIQRIKSRQLGVSAALSPLLLAGVIAGLISGCSQPLPKSSTTTATAGISSAANSEIAALEMRCAQEPNNAELRYELSLAYLADAEKKQSPASRTLAEDSLKKVLQLVPGNPATLKLLYYEETVKGDALAYSKANTIFAQLTPASRRQVNAPSLGIFLHNYVAQKKSGHKNTPLLHRTLLDAIHEQPQADKAYIQLARMYREEEFYPLALATLKLGEEQIKDSEGLYEAIANTYEARAEASGCSYEKTAYLQDALRYYQQAIPLAASSPELHFALARLFLDANHYQLALHESAILMELDPSPENIAFYAQNYSILGHDQKAYTLLEQAKSKGLGVSDSAYHEIYMNSGDWMKAALSFTEYLQSQPNINVYDAIKADIIGQQADWDFTKIIAQKKLVFNSEWEAAVYAYWTNKMTRNDLQNNAKNRCERTEYLFYSGYRDYRAGNIAAAKQHFSAALQQNTYRFIERPLARHFLSSMNR
jgi:hypothetical protein